MYERLTVDELMTKFKDRSTINPSMPAKPVKTSYKVYMIAYEKGYCQDFDFYVRKNGNEVENNLGTRVVFQITSGLKNRQSLISSLQILV